MGEQRETLPEERATCQVEQSVIQTLERNTHINLSAFFCGDFHLRPVGIPLRFRRRLQHCWDQVRKISIVSLKYNDQLATSAD